MALRSEDTGWSSGANGHENWSGSGRHRTSCAVPGPDAVHAVVANPRLPFAGRGGTKDRSLPAMPPDPSQEDRRARSWRRRCLSRRDPGSSRVRIRVKAGPEVWPQPLRARNRPGPAVLRGQCGAGRPRVARAVVQSVAIAVCAAVRVTGVGTDGLVEGVLDQVLAVDRT